MGNMIAQVAGTTALAAAVGIGAYLKSKEADAPEVAATNLMIAERDAARAAVDGGGGEPARLRYIDAMSVLQDRHNQRYDAMVPFAGFGAGALLLAGGIPVAADMELWNGRLANGSLNLLGKAGVVAAVVLGAALLGWGAGISIPGTGSADNIPVTSVS